MVGVKNLIAFMAPISPAKRISRMLRQRKMRIFFPRAKRNYKNTEKVVAFVFPGEALNLRKYLRDYSVQFVKYELHALRSIRIAAALVAFIYFGLSISPALYLTQHNVSSAVRASSFLLSYLALAIPVLFAGLLTLVYSQQVYSVLIGQVMLAIVFGIIVISVPPHEFNNPWTVVGNETGWSYFRLNTALTSGLFTIIFIPSFLIASQINERRLLRTAPRYALIYELMLIMARLAEGSMNFSRPKTKSYIIAHLERAATFLGIGIPKAADIPTFANRAILQEKCSVQRLRFVVFKYR